MVVQAHGKEYKMKVTMEQKIFNYVKSNQEKTTLVGKLITVNHVDNDDDDDQIREFSKWFGAFIESAEQYYKNNK